MNHPTGPHSDSLSGSHATQPVTLTNCDREPIHQLGRVQSYGALVAVSQDWIVQHASENLPEILGIPLEHAIGLPLGQLISAEGFQRIRRNLRSVELKDGAARLFGVELLQTQGPQNGFDVCLHQSGRHLIIEFEPKITRRDRDVLTEVYPQIAALRREKGMDILARDAARGLREICGFDSVMVYQFQPDHSGKVIAEQRADGQSKYNGMMFPASDIPVQARALYKRSLLRLIADVNDRGSAVYPAQDINDAPLDLSLAVTRAVSPIHVEYLRNMGVAASMSVSIMKDGELWGLFACHHHSPRYIDYERRTAIEMFAHLFSYEIARFEEGLRKKVEAQTSRMQSRLMAQMAEGATLSDSLMAVSHDIGDVIAHDGLVLYENETFHATGAAPTEDEFRAIARLLDTRAGAGTFATDRLGALHDPARDYADRCAGMMAIPVSKRPRDYLILFRKPVASTVSWAGDPSKAVEVGPNGTRLTPRKSFDVWRETVEGQSAPWSAQEFHAADLLRTVLLEIFLKVTDAANLERKRAQEQQQLLISELNHRVRNILNLMRGLLAQSRSSAGTLEEFTKNLDGRIQALARAHDQLTSEQWEPTSIKSLIQCEFDAYADAKASRVEISGSDAMISPNAFTTLALVLHEMATNSIKYGALCDRSGRVLVSLREDASGGLVIDWVERGGPPVTPPKRRGFGSLIIESSIPHELKGDAEVSYKMSGLEARFRLPPAVISSFEREIEDAAPVPDDAPPSETFTLSGQGFVLEDTLIIAMDAAGIMEDMGAQEVAIISTVAAAMKHLETAHVDFAVLDVNLGDEQSVSVAHALYERGTPFVLATGYGAAADLMDTYPPCVVVQKPFSTTSLQSALAQAFAKAR